jgi:hypothetical protein
MPSVPVPAIPDTVTVRLVVPEPDTPTVPEAVPVVFNVISPEDSVTVPAPLYVTAYVTGPLFVSGTDGAPMPIVGGVVSSVTVMVSAADVLGCASVPVTANSFAPAASVPLYDHVVDPGVYDTPFVDPFTSILTRTLSHVPSSVTDALFVT